MRPGRRLSIVVVALLLAGCSNDEVSIPEDWSVYEAEGVTLAYPPDWEVRDEHENGVDIVGPEGGDLAPIVSLRWGDKTFVSATDSLQALRGNLTLQLPDFEAEEAEPIEVPGATDAAWRRAEYVQPLPGDQEIPVVELQAMVVGVDREFLLRAAHRADEFDQMEDVLEGIIDTLALGGGG